MHRLRRLLPGRSLRSEVLVSFVLTSSLLVALSLAVNSWLSVNAVRAQRRAEVARVVDQLQASLDSSRFLDPNQQRQILRLQLASLSNGRSDVVAVRLRSGEVLLPPNWFEAPQSQLRALLLEAPSTMAAKVLPGPLGDRFEVQRIDLGRSQGLVIETYRNITLEDQLIRSQLLQLALFLVLDVAVVVVVGLWLSRRVTNPLLLLDRSIAGLTPDNLPNTLVELDGAPQELRHLGASTMQMASRLGEAWDAQKLFVSAVSHELRNALTVMTAYLGRVRRRPETMTPKQLAAIDLVLAEHTRLGEMVGQLLKISRSDLGELSVTLEPTPLVPLLQQAVTSISQLSGRTVDLQLDAGTESVVVLADGSNLSQVVANLIENAAKYSPPGCPIVVQLSRRDGAAVVAIIDQGIGIPEPERERIFERFYRASNASAFASGTGLGLALDQILIQRMHGTIALLQSGPTGSTFAISLPLSAP